MSERLLVWYASDARRWCVDLHSGARDASGELVSDRHLTGAEFDTLPEAHDWAMRYVAQRRRERWQWLADHTPPWATAPAADAIRIWAALDGQPDQVVAGVCAAVEGDLFATTPTLHVEDKSGWPRCAGAAR
jgi:hypothetical protein